MRKAMVCIAAFLLLAPLASAAGIEGKWSAEFQAKKKAKAAAPATLSLSSDGKQISGSVSSGKRAMTIQDGKLDGSSFSFVTVRSRRARPGSSGAARWTATRSAARGLVKAVNEAPASSPNEHPKTRTQSMPDTCAAERNGCR